MIDDDEEDLRFGLMAASLAIVAWGLGGVIAKSIDLDPIAIAFYRFATYSILLMAFLGARSQRTPVTWRVMRYSMAGGISLGLNVILFFTAVKLTTVVNATTIGAMQPLVLAFFAVRMFGERISAREIGAALVALGGVIVVVFASSGTPEWSGSGDLAAVAALFTWSGYFLFSKRSKGVLTSSEYTVGTGVWTSLLSLPAGFIFGQDMSFPASGTWVPLIALVVVAGVIGHSTMNWALTRIPLWIGSMLTLLIPVISAIAAWIWLDEALTAVHVVAMAVVLASLGYVVWSQSARKRSTGQLPVAVAG